MESNWNEAFMREIKLNKLYQTIGYPFNNVALFEQAMTHRSCENRPNNERLEFLGDSILGFVIAEALYQRFPQCTEGELTRLRASLVKGETLAKLSLEKGLSEVMNLGLGELTTGGSRRQSTLEDAFEAMIGAIYLDSNFDTVKKLISQWFEPLLKTVNITNIPRDYKSRLQEKLQGKSLPIPQYEILREEGPDHSKIFFVRCSVLALNLIGEGKGPSRKTAEQEAAKKILELLSSED